MLLVIKPPHYIQQVRDRLPQIYIVGGGFQGFDPRERGDGELAFSGLVLLCSLLRLG